MSYEIELSEEFDRDIAKHKKAGSKLWLKKINDLVNEIRIEPTKGTGEPEHLKYFVDEIWSRKISQKHRLIYKIKLNHVVEMLSAYGHYNDK